MCITLVWGEETNNCESPEPIKISCGLDLETKPVILLLGKPICLMVNETLLELGVEI